MESKESENFLDSTLDLSKQFLKKIERANDEQKHVTALIVDDNEIQRLDTLDSYANLKKLSLMNNQLVRMYGVSQLIHLEVLNLTNNLLVTIEGLKDLKNLKELYLGKNKIKIVEHLDNNVNLEIIDLSENNIAHIIDISSLKCLKELYLHGNKLTHLRQCEKSLPNNIETLTLHDNLICDLNEVSHLMPFSFITKLTFAGNPCIDFANNLQQAFNYRPFIKNWCSSLKVLDNQPLDDIECLKAEWLYSQGRGRSFRPGEQAALVEYLINVCPSKEPNDEAEDVKKLKLILSKAQQHQKQLEEQFSTGILSLQDTIKISKKKKLTGLHERMVTSYQDCANKNRKNSPDLMTRSLDSGISRNFQNKSSKGVHEENVCHKGSPFLGSPARFGSFSSRTSKSSSRNSPHSSIESKRKASFSSVKKQIDHSGQFLMKKQQKLGRSTKEFEFRIKETSEEEEGFTVRKRNPAGVQKPDQKRLIHNFCDVGKNLSRGKEFCSCKKSIATKENAEIETSFDGKAWKAAICIQKRWRGYRARNLNRRVLAVCKDIQLCRIQEYITKVISEMEATRIALEGNRKLQVLQMQAINAIWKKMVTLQPNETTGTSNESTFNLQEIVAICSNLNKQVEGLQSMIKGLQHSSVSCQSTPIATQTDIVAVHMPQDNITEIFPCDFNSEVGNGKTSKSSNADIVDVTCKNEEELLSAPIPEFTEIYTNKSLAENVSDSELIFVASRDGEKKAKCKSLELHKPLEKHQEAVTNINKSVVDEKRVYLEYLKDSNDVQNGEIPKM